MDLAQALEGLQCCHCGPKLDCAACTGLAPAVRNLVETMEAVELASVPSSLSLPTEIRFYINTAMWVGLFSGLLFFLSR